MPDLAACGYDTYALSLRYHESWRGYMVFHASRIRDYVEDVAAVVAQLPSPPILVGHSMGGYIIMKYLERYHNIPAAVLLSSIPVNGFWRGFWRTIRMFWWEHTISTLSLKRNVFQVSAHQFDRYCFMEPMRPDRLAVYHSRLHLESFFTLWDMIIGDLPRPSRAQALPMLVLGGAHDVIFDGSELRATAGAYGADLEIFPDLAHDIIREEGHDRTAARIAEWLAGVGLGMEMQSEMERQTKMEG